MTMKNGQRCSAARAYLAPARKRKNLEIITHAHTQSVIFDKRRAVAVRVKINGIETVIKARREIILSAGAISSPDFDVVGHW